MNTRCACGAPQGDRGSPWWAWTLFRFLPGWEPPPLQACDSCEGEEVTVSAGGSVSAAGSEACVGTASSEDAATDVGASAVGADPLSDPASTLRLFVPSGGGMGGRIVCFRFSSTSICA